MTLAPPPPPPSSCVVSADTFAPDPPTRLVTRSGVAFAEVRAASDVTLKVGDATIALTTRGVRLVTPARTSVISLRARIAHVFRGILTPGGMTPLAWTAAPHGVSIAPEPDARLAWIGATPTDAVACSDVALDSALDASAWPARATSVTLRAGSIPIAATPGGAAVAMLRGGIDVLVTERRGGAARIVWNVPDGALADARVEGWVDASSITEDGALQAGTIGPGKTGMGLDESSEWGGCRHDHPLFVEVGGRVERVGSILAGTRVENLRPAEHGLVRVDVLGPETRASPPELALLPGASFLLATGAASDCD